MSHTLITRHPLPIPRIPVPIRSASEPSRYHPYPAPTPVPAIPPPVDYLAVLGLPAHASDREITSAWRDRVLALHPDKRSVGGGAGAGAGALNTGVDGDGTDTNLNPGYSDGAAAVDIRLVNEARWVLSDPARRKEWKEAFQGGSSRVAVMAHRHVGYGSTEPQSECAVLGVRNRRDPR